MTYEEMQRMMEFILEQQAQLTANQQRADERAARADERAAKADERAAKADERIARADERINRANTLITRTARTVDRLATVTVERTSALSEELDAKFAALVDAQMRTEEGMKKSDEIFNARINVLIESQMRTEEAVKRLSERGEKTDEAVRNLTDVVYHHLRDHRNGERDVSRE